MPYNIKVFDNMHAYTCNGYIGYTYSYHTDSFLNIDLYGSISLLSPPYFQFPVIQK